MSFFDIEEAHAVMLAYAANGGATTREYDPVSHLHGYAWVETKSYKARSGPGACCFRGCAHFFKSIALRWGQAFAWIIGKEQAQSTCPARPVEWELVIFPSVLNGRYSTG